MEATAPKQRINALFGKYKYPILVALVGLGLMLLPSGQGPTEPAEPPRAVEHRLGENGEALRGRSRCC